MAENDHSKDPFEWVRKKAAEASARLEQKAAETPEQLWLPGFDPVRDKPRLCLPRVRWDPLALARPVVIQRQKTPLGGAY